MQSTRRKGYWKINASVLKHVEYNNGIKDLIQEVLQDDSILSSTQKFEFMKHKICQYSPSANTLKGKIDWKNNISLRRCVWSITNINKIK